MPEPVDPFTSLLVKFWGKNEELYRRVAAGLATPEIIAEEISPSGSMTFRNGANIVFFYDIERGLKLRSYENGKAEITPYTYRELMEKTRELASMEEAGGKRHWQEQMLLRRRNPDRKGRKYRIYPCLTRPMWQICQI